MSREILTLSIETATMAGSLAVSRGSELLMASEGNPETSHSNTLLADLDQLFSHSKVELSDVELFAVAIGPGSFTGLRIGLATVKALAESLNRPFIGVPTLAAIAHSAGVSDLTVALLPAGRGEVFAQSFAVSSNGFVKELDEPAHLPPRLAITRYESEPTVVWAGEGASIHKEMINDVCRQLTGKHWSVTPPPSNLARHVALLSYQKWERNELQNPDQLQALYVRPSDAEIKVNVDR